MTNLYAEDVNMTKTPKRRGAPTIRREPLTKKAKAAIRRYVLIRCGDAKIIDILITYCLEAERMRRADLYAWLATRGYRWQPQRNDWGAIGGAHHLSRRRATGSIGPPAHTSPGVITTAPR
jgi:hypothetical protein